MTETRFPLAGVVARAFITDLSADLHDAGFRFSAERTRGHEAVREWTRNGVRVWALVDMRTNEVLRTNAIRLYRRVGTRTLIGLGK